MNILEHIGQHRLVPIFTLDSADHAMPLADALVAGGLPVGEVTFRTAAAEASIRKIASRGDFLIGAGTVLSIDLVKKAVDAGARFMVTPGFDPKVVEYCLVNQIPITPGTITPSDLSIAHGMGLGVVKFFPAESFGGLATLKAIAAPFNMMKFIPTGGITTASLPQYLAFKPVLAVGGSWFAPRELVGAGKWGEIAEIARQSVQIVKSVK